MQVIGWLPTEAMIWSLPGVPGSPWYPTIAAFLSVAHAIPIPSAQKPGRRGKLPLGTSGSSSPAGKRGQEVKGGDCIAQTVIRHVH